MDFKRIFIICSVFILTSELGLSQFDSNRSLSVQVRVLEQLKGNIQPLISAPLELAGLGKYETNEDGRFAFRVPLKELEEIDYKIVVKVMKDNYKVVKPYLFQALDQPIFFF